MVFRNLNKQVFYKPYPASFDRNEEIDPILDEIDGYKNIHIIKNNKDAMMMIIGNSRLIICTTASNEFFMGYNVKCTCSFYKFSKCSAIKKENSIFR